MPLWTPHLHGPARYQAQERIVTLGNGERVRVSVDDSGTVTQIEHTDRLDAIVRPATITMRVRPHADR